MTQWVPHWRGMGWRINPAQPVDSLDLFQRLGTAIFQFEQKAHIMIGFSLQSSNSPTRVSQLATQAANTTLAKQQQAQNKSWAGVVGC